jgi:hypothetical protein
MRGLRYVVGAIAAAALLVAATASARSPHADRDADTWVRQSGLRIRAASTPRSRSSHSAPAQNHLRISGNACARGVAFHDAAYRAA